MIYCSIDITGTDSDLRRAEAIRHQLVLEKKAAVVPFLLFREQMILGGDVHREILQYTVHLMSGCSEVRLYDNPETSVTCARDREFALKIGIPVVVVGENRSLQENELRETMQYYAMRLGGFPTRMSIDEIQGYLADGMEGELIRRAIDIGIERQKPWSYINGVLRNFKAQGIFTLLQLKDDQKKKSDKMATSDLGAYNALLDKLPE